MPRSKKYAVFKVNPCAFPGTCDKWPQCPYQHPYECDMKTKNQTYCTQGAQCVSYASHHALSQRNSEAVKAVKSANEVIEVFDVAKVVQVVEVVEVAKVCAYRGGCRYWPFCHNLHPAEVCGYKDGQMYCKQGRECEHYLSHGKLWLLNSEAAKAAEEAKAVADAADLADLAAAKAAMIAADKADKAEAMKDGTRAPPNHVAQRLFNVTSEQDQKKKHADAYNAQQKKLKDMGKVTDAQHDKWEDAMRGAAEARARREAKELALKELERKQRMERKERSATMV